MYTGHRPLKPLRHHLTLSLMPNSNYESFGIEPLCSNIAFNKNPYHLDTNQLTPIADQWTVKQWHKSLLKIILEQKITKTSIPSKRGHIHCSDNCLILEKLKLTLMQIWKSPNMFLFIQKQYPENFAFLILTIHELFTREVSKCLKK